MVFSLKTMAMSTFRQALCQMQLSELIHHIGNNEKSGDIKLQWYTLSHLICWILCQTYHGYVFGSWVRTMYTGGTPNDIDIAIHGEIKTEVVVLGLQNWLVAMLKLSSAYVIVQIVNKDRRDTNYQICTLKVVIISANRLEFMIDIVEKNHKLPHSYHPISLGCCLMWTPNNGTQFNEWVCRNVSNIAINLSDFLEQLAAGNDIRYWQVCALNLTDAYLDYLSHQKNKLTDITFIEGPYDELIQPVRAKKIMLNDTYPLGQYNSDSEPEVN